VFCLSALITPSGMEIATASRIAPTPSCALFGRASAITSVTWRSRKVNDTPKSPRIAFQTYKANCSGSGLSKPYFRFSCSTTCCVRLLFSPLSQGPPGAAWARVKVTRRTMKSVGIISRSRRIVYFSTSPPPRS
jgi:hypothetical protein